MPIVEATRENAQRWATKTLAPLHGNKVAECELVAVAVVIPVGANLLWHLIETDPNDTE